MIILTEVLEASRAIASISDSFTSFPVTGPRERRIVKNEEDVEERKMGKCGTLARYGPCRVRGILPQIYKFQFYGQLFSRYLFLTMTIDHLIRSGR